MRNNRGTGSFPAAIRKVTKTVINTAIRTVSLFLAALFAAAALLAVPPTALEARAQDSFFAYTNPDTNYVVYMNDEYDLLSDEEESRLIEEMIPLTEYGNAGFLSCENNSESTSSYSARVYSSLFGTESGTLLVIDMGQRMLYIKSNGAISEIVSNAYSNTITDNIYRYASDGDYYTCASKAYSQVYTLLGGGKIAQPMRYISAALLALVLGLMINYLIVRTVSKPRKAGTDEIIDAADVDFRLRDPAARHSHTTKVYSPVRSSGGGGGGSRGGGGGFSGGGGSGGGHRF